MNVPAFFTALDPLVVQGTAQLADTIRHLVYATTPWVLEKIDFTDDRLFLDPRLFAVYISGEGHRAPELLGVADGEARCRLPAATASARVPAHPKLRTLSPASPEAAVFTLKRPDSQPVVITTTLDPAVAAALQMDPSVLEESATGIALVHWQTELSHAWRVLELSLPALHRLLCQTLQTILLFDVAAQNSFASLSAHGLVGINIGRERGLAFCLDEIAHQGGHVVFNAATSDTDRWLAIDPCTPLPAITGKVDDSRELYAAFHGLFTYTCILSALDAAARYAWLSTDEAVLARGRIAFYLRKFAQDRTMLDRRSLYTDDGAALFEQLASAYEHFHERYSAHTDDIELGGQPYTFCSRTFLSENPQLSVSPDTAA